MSRSLDADCRFGTVVSTDEGTARVRVSKVSCAGCEIAGACLASMDSGEDVVIARDPLGVSAGDRVEIGIAPASEVQIACTLYLVPAICLIFGVAVGGWIGGLTDLDPTIASLLIGLFAAALSLWPARRFARRAGVVPVVLRREG